MPIARCCSSSRPPRWAGAATTGRSSTSCCRDPPPPMPSSATARRGAPTTYREALTCRSAGQSWSTSRRRGRRRRSSNGCATRAGGRGAADADVRAVHVRSSPPGPAAAARFRMADFYRAQRGASTCWSNPTATRRRTVEPRRGEPGTTAAGATRTLDVPGRGVPDEDDIDAAVRRDLDDVGHPDRRHGRAATVRGDRDGSGRRTRPLRHATASPRSGRTRTRSCSGDWAMAHSLLSVPLNLGLLDPLKTAGRRRARLPPRRGRAQRRRGVRPPGHRVAGVRLAPLLALRRDYRRANALAARRPLPAWFADLDADAVEAACLRTALAGVRDRGWVAPHPAAHGARQPRAATRLRPRRDDRVVPTGSWTASTGSCRRT